MIGRRDFLRLTSATLSVHPFAGRFNWLIDNIPDDNKRGAMVLTDQYPAYPSKLIQQIVTVAHFDLNALKDLVKPHPHLVKAAWDWGFGDWETPLGAACHMGRRDISEFLLSEGATPSLFSWVLFGDLQFVKQIIERVPTIQRTSGPHSISLLAHARMGGKQSEAVLEYLASLGDADIDAPVPLSEKETRAISGTYHVGGNSVQQIQVSADMSAYEHTPMYTHPPQLNWARPGAMPRPLFHLGKQVFHPADASSIQVRFEAKAYTMNMTIFDGEDTLNASRAEGD